MLFVMLCTMLAFQMVADASPSPSVAPTAAVPVLPPAGSVPAQIALDVSGMPSADPAFLDTKIRDALDRAIRPTLRPGASAAYGPIVPWPLVAVDANRRAAVSVVVTIAGDGSATVNATTLVVVSNVVAMHAEPTLLFLSDDPEYLTGEGEIYRGDVTATRPARLYYYHSDAGVPRDLDVVLTANAPARVHLVDAASGPELDVMDVGHSVSRDYLRYRSGGLGTYADVVPGTPYVVHHALLLPGEVVAGVVDVAVVAGGAVAASVVASPAGARIDAYLAGPRVPFDGHHRHGTFDLATYGATHANFTVGSDAAIRYGGRIPSPQNVDPHDDGRDYGDYGVARSITFTLDNPTDASHLIYLYEKPVGGPVRSTFVVDNETIEIGCVRLPQSYAVKTYQLPPHSSGTSTIETMTDGGSFYPLEFGVTETQPQMTTPPVGSPDGCSPAPPGESPIGSALK